MHGCRLREAMKEQHQVIDVDGSYLQRKHQQLTQRGEKLAPLGLPPCPPFGWKTVSERNYCDISKEIPKVTQGRHSAAASF